MLPRVGGQGEEGSREAYVGLASGQLEEPGSVSEDCGMEGRGMEGRGMEVMEIEKAGNVLGGHTN